MIYKVTDEKNRTATYTSSQLLQLIFKAALDKLRVEERKGSTEMVGILGDVLTSSRTLLNNTFLDVLLIGFNCGFYYARFLSLNQIELIESKDEDGNNSTKTN